MYGMFKDSCFNNDLDKWNVSQVTMMTSMFEGTDAFNGNISKWDVSKVGNVNSMFYDAEKFDKSNLNKVQRKENMFC